MKNKLGSFVAFLAFMFLFFILNAQTANEFNFKFHEVNDKRFSEIKDSLYKTPGGFRYHSDVYPLTKWSK